MIDSTFSLDVLNTMSKGNMVEHLGIKYTALTPTTISGTMPVDNRTVQPMGVLHGGASVVLAETLGSVGSNLCIDQTKYYCVGLQINANHIKTGHMGTVVTGTATLLHEGKSTHVWDIVIKNESEEVVCLSRLTMAILERRA